MDLPVALDAMGGDHAPQATVAGAARAAAAGIPVMLVGDETRLAAALHEQGADVPVRHAPDAIGMHEHAADVRRRRDSSIMVAARLVKDGEASGLVSMGHSGATMAASLLVLGRIAGVDRPAIIANVPTDDGACVLLDVGANADVRPVMLQQFAVMGSLYARLVFGVEEPTVGLMSIGEEPSKGNELVREAHPLLAATPGVRFHGNVEGRDLLAGTTDVVVTDGFTGNVMLKLAEGEARVLFGWIKEALGGDLRSRIGALLARPALRSVAAKLDPSAYGAQPLLGVAAPSFIGHGSSDATAVHNALRFAHDTATRRLVPRIAEALAVLREERPA